MTGAGDCRQAPCSDGAVGARHHADRCDDCTTPQLLRQWHVLAGLSKRPAAGAAQPHQLFHYQILPPVGRKNQSFSPCCQWKFSSIHNSLSQVQEKDHSNLSWLSKPVEQWQEDQEYKIVQKLCVVNDPNERAVKLAGNRICTVRSEKAFQESLLTVQELRRLSADIERGTFTKNQLLTVIRKMLLIEDLE